MKIEENITLAPYTTFKIGGPARYFCRTENEDDVVEAAKFAKKNKLPILVLGGGSNLLVSDAGFPGIVIKMEIMGINKVALPQNANEASDKILFQVGAGESWDNFVERAVSEGLYGIENLSSIPGTVGATPVQNIAAYGSEVSKVIHSVRVLDLNDMKFVEIPNSQCRFGYRNSLFKHERGRYVITRVDYELQINGRINVDYKDLHEYFSNMNVSSPTLEQIRRVVIEIRSSKLPDWTCWGTAGSFFKNPIISMEHWNKLKNKYPDLQGFPGPDGRMKVSLGWILDKVCGAKGLMKGKVGTYEKQALVFISKPGATSTEVIALANELMERVKEKTGIQIEVEVEWVC